MCHVSNTLYFVMYTCCVVDSIHQSIYVPAYLHIHLCICLSAELSINLPIYPSIHLSIYFSVCLSVCLSIYPTIYVSIYLPICLSIYPSICLSIYEVYALALQIIGVAMSTTMGSTYGLTSKSAQTCWVQEHIFNGIGLIIVVEGTRPN